MTCDDGNDVDWDGCTNGQISEWLVNVTTLFDQARPAAGTFKDGRFFVVWETDYALGNCDGERARWYLADGTPEGDDAPLQGEPNCGTFAQAISRFDGGVLVGWNGNQVTSFDPAGAAQGTVHLNATYGVVPNHRQTLAPLLGGRLAGVAEVSDGSGLGIFFQFFEQDGSAATAAIRANSYTFASQEHPAMASYVTGGVMVVWQSLEQDGDGHGIYAGTFDDNGDSVVDEFLVNVDTAGSQTMPRLAILETGRTLVIWKGQGTDGQNGLWGRLFDGLGKPISGQFEISLGNSISYQSVVPLADGRFLVVWNSQGIRFQILEQDGSKTGQQVVASTVVIGVEHPNAATFSDGGFILVWHASALDGSGLGVFALRFNPDGTKKYL